MMTRSVIAIVKGGLGNQMFIYAAARAFALRTGRELLLDNVTGFKHDEYERSYRLDRFDIRAHVAPTDCVPWPHLRHPRHKIIRTCNKLLPRSWRYYIAEQHRLSATQLTQFSPRQRRIILNGYWQSEDYFADQVQVIRKELAPPIPESSEALRLGEELASCESVFLHVRRCRYKPLLSKDYYQQAIKEAIEGLERPHFYLFGDDLDWPQLTLSFESCPVRVVHYDQFNELIDLWLMSRCRHAIVANSSFSWWSAWLGGETENTLRHVWTPSNAGWPIKPAATWQRLSNTLTS